MQKIDIIAGARPNFMKIGPIIHAIHRHNDALPDDKLQYRLIHTGQHYDKKMSEDFFRQLDIPEPHLNLGVGSGSHATQTSKIMVEYEAALQQWKPDLCLVVGDVTSTMACAITAKKLWVKVAHVEGGIRSGDHKMPEEINRLVTDSITDYFFTTTDRANENLLREGHSEEKIFFVGNTMIDSLKNNLNRLIQPAIWEKESLSSRNYLVMTLHRPSNVDDPNNLKALLETIHALVHPLKVVFPMHPRTKKNYEQLHLKLPSIIITEPMSYLEFIYLVRDAKGVITDSGGITEETTVLDVPCITLRDSTERPETVSMGTNELVGTNPENLKAPLRNLMSGQWKKGYVPPLWDGRTSERIVSIISGL